MVQDEADDRDALETDTGLFVPRRRVPASLRLVGRGPIRGELYAELRHADGGPGRVLKRLNDETERFLPMAVGDAHLLLRKAHIVTVELDGIEVEPPPDSSRVTRVRIGLVSGPDVEGSVDVSQGLSKMVRTLDYLNDFAAAFHCVRSPRGVLLVNALHITMVTELRNREHLID